MSETTPGQIVRSARESAGLTREQLALRAGVSTSTIARLELADRLPKAHGLGRIAAVLDVPVASLLVEPVAA